MRKVGVAALWVAVRIASRQLANVAVFFWLAFELVPTDLGVASLGVTLALFTIPLVTRGLREAVIQRETLDEALLATAFGANVVLGLGLCLMLLALAPATGALFGDDRLPALAAVAATIPLLAALGNLQETLWERDFGYRRITVIYMIAALTSSAGAVMTALSGAAIWALVVFNVTSYASVTALMWLAGSWRPRARPDVATALVLLRFAAPIMVSQTIATGNQRLVEMIAGALLSPAAAAFVRFGGNFSRLLNQIFVTPVIQVLMPAFARSTASPEANLRRVLVVNAAVLLFVFMLAAAMVPEFVRGVFGMQWDMAGKVAAALCFGVYSALIGPVAYPLLVVQGRGDWTVALTLAGLVVTVVFVAVGAQFGAVGTGFGAVSAGPEAAGTGPDPAGTGFGAVGAALGFALRGVVTIPLTLYVLRRALDIAPRGVLAAVLPFALAASGVYLLLELVVGPLVGPWPLAAGLLVQIVTGTLLYLGLVRFGVRAFAPKAYDVLRTIIPRRLHRLL